MPKYPNPRNAVLTEHTHFEILEKRGIKKLRFQRLKSFDKLTGVEFNLREEHVWSFGDNLMKLSQRYYGSQEFWWVIGLVNGKPTDSHYSNGDVVYIIDNPNLIVEAIR